MRATVNTPMKTPRKTALIGAYPASVVMNSLQAVFDLRVGGPATPGIRTPTQKTLGIDTLPANCSFSGTFLAITGNATFNNWNFSIPGFLYIYVDGAATTATFNDCNFGPTVNDPAVARTDFYGIKVSDNGTAATANFNYCTFNGGKFNSNLAVNGPWSGTVIYILTGATVTATKCRFTGIPYDVVKVTNATYNQIDCLIEAFGWNLNSDADGVQQISGTINIERCLYDIIDGDLNSLASVFPGQPPNSALFCTIDTPSTQDGAVTVKNNIFKGFSTYGTSKGTPFNVVNVADNHTATGNGWHIRNGIWQNNVIEIGNSGYWIYGGTETSAVSIASWTTNRDYFTGSLIAAPSF